MTNVNPKRELDCPFTHQPIKQAYGPEVSMFVHCHLRRYDRTGEGIQPNDDYFDKYGSPVSRESSWEEGYHLVEKQLANHYNFVVDNELDFPLIAGMGGAAHLYKSKHDDNPSDWTGWIPQQRRWLSQGYFFSNRYFLGLRGNEIQNNLWDYDPYEEEEEDTNELIYSQIEPIDKYRGGYWFYNQPYGRYLHIISLKSHEKDSEEYPRYNYIVHPLAYRSSIDTLPDNSVDAMQLAIINMPEEGHFGKGEPWGAKCHGLEVFNDFTYFYSYQRLSEDGPHNGELCLDKNYPIGDHRYYFWFDTYPMEFAVFLLDSALARGVYYHTVSANDAFYERTIEEDKEPNDTLVADPKGWLLKYNLKHRDPSDPRLGVLHIAQSMLEANALAGILKERPYGISTSFGYVTLLDPSKKIKNAVFHEENGIPHMGFNAGETLAMEYLRNGDYYSTTGLRVFLKYEFLSAPPYTISGQPEQERLCYDLTDDMELKFTFLKCTDGMADLIWRYKIMFETSVEKIETSYGYFKLDTDHQTTLDLRQSYSVSKVKWLYFTAISPKNPQHRAWFHAVRGPAFGAPEYHAPFLNIKHNVFRTARNDDTVTEAERIEPTPVDKGELDFMLGKECNDEYVYVYLMQVNPLQQDFSEPVNENIKQSSDLIPPRFLQSVHGYFPCRNDHPTRICLSASWDKNTVKDDKVYFYRIDVKSGEPVAMATDGIPEPFSR